MFGLKKILVLGGTAEARDIANQLVAFGHHVTTSLAGVTANPLLPSGNIRSGGFGGSAGLHDYITNTAVDVVVDATHPFAAIISRNAHEAVQNTKAALIRFERPAWQAVARDQWISVSALKQAAAVLPAGSKVFITTGRKDLQPFLERKDLSGVIRTVEPPSEKLPTGWRVILDRPPHLFDSENALFQAESFTHIVSKNAGGDATRAKLDAARDLGLPVIMVERPFKPNCETYDDVSKLIKRLGT